MTGKLGEGRQAEGANPGDKHRTRTKNEALKDKYKASG